MFDWKKDRKALDEGPFEFRIETESKGDLLKLLGNEWREFMKKLNA